MGNNRFECGLNVVKMGSDTVVRDGQFDADFGRSVAKQVADAHRNGVGIIMTSSGAMALGTSRLGLDAPRRDRFIAGQKVLRDGLTASFASAGLPSQEVLFTSENRDAADEQIQRVLALGGVPFINGDDSSLLGHEGNEDISNNDILAGQRARRHGADFLNLTVTEGVLDEQGAVMPWVTDMSQVIIFDSRSQHGTGGMRTKLEAAFAVVQIGRRAAIAYGRRPKVISDFADGKHVGTGIAA